MVNSKYVLYGVATFGVLWNIFGVVQFLGSVRTTPESPMLSGLTASQVAVMTSYPLWMTVVFAIGVFGGLLASVVLLLKRKESRWLFGASLVGYIILFVGDITEGVFAVMGSNQVLILSVVIAIAAGLLWYSAYACRQVLPMKT